MNRMISILVVEDTTDLLMATERLLRFAGYQVFVAETGAACLNVMRTVRPDLVLLDVHLPDILGYEVCRQIKADNELQHTYVVMLSGKMMTSDNQSEGLEIGADGYLVRPIANRELLARIQSIARIINAERERDRLILQLQQALATIKNLSGMLPICAQCKKIRDDQGDWQAVEVYVKKHSDAEFSHTICPECEKELYGEI